MKNYLYSLCILLLVGCHAEKTLIDREALVSRNNPLVTSPDSLSSLSVGNGGFAMTVDVTGLQTFPNAYRNGVPLGTQSDWGWHRFANPERLDYKETWVDYDFGRGRKEPYAVQVKEKGRKQNAVEWYRANPHRLHLGNIGLELGDSVQPSDLKDIHQQLDMWRGMINSRFSLNHSPVEVQTVCHPKKDIISARIVSPLKPAVRFRFAYPTGAFADDACDWTKNELHSTVLLNQSAQSVQLERKIDDTTYYVTISWTGNAEFKEKEKHNFLLIPQDETFSFSCSFAEEASEKVLPDFKKTELMAAGHWKNYWEKGGVVDFSACKDPRARELERRVVLSQYLLAIQCAGDTPPQETGLTYNSWYGKFHLEMIWWHQAQFALWGHPELLEHTLSWYEKAYPMAKEIARRQGFAGVRWMKMTDPSSIEAPSGVGSFLIWQQPHLIYLAELLYRANPSDTLLRKYGQLVEETAEFMYSFADYDKENDRYLLKGIIPAQETLEPAETVNPPFELSYWHCALGMAQKWREYQGQERKKEWEAMINKLSPLAAQEDSLYLAAETAKDTYKDIRFTSDHMAVLGAYGILPASPLVNNDYMRKTLHWVWDNWNWDRTWGWDYPMTAMNAARLGEPEKAIGALLMDKRTNTYLVNGHNYQDNRLRIYLPGNGGLLTAVAMMCAGWDGCKEANPGFPKDGNWDVKWEGLLPMP